MSYDIEYKTGDTDDVGAVLSMDGEAIDLTGMAVSFVMKRRAQVRANNAADKTSIRTFVNALNIDSRIDFEGEVNLSGA